MHLSRPRTLAPLALIALAMTASPLRAQETLDLDAITRIRQEGLHRSQVMTTLTHLTDAIGARVTGSPAMLEANEWTRARLVEWGMQNARLEPFDFGRGWSFDRCEVRMSGPRMQPLVAYPQAWTPGTDGPVRGLVLRLEAEEPRDLAQYAGKLAGKILFLSEPREVVLDDNPRFDRYDADELADLCGFPIPDGKSSSWLENARKRWQLQGVLDSMAVAEGAIATVEISSRDHGIVRVTRGGSESVSRGPGVCGLQMATEHYNLVLRRLEAGDEVELEIDVASRFHDEDLRAFNTMAEIEGAGKRDEIVMLGAHLDSWHAGTGATDNAAGSAVMMEAMRILGSLDRRPLRTIRLALWSGEEQGLRGSRAYVEDHLATRPAPTDSAQLALPLSLREATWPIMPRPHHRRLSAYFNLDNGAGRIRGIYAQENVAAADLFAQWLRPLHDLGATDVTLQSTGSTDHVPFDRVGLPGFQFIQDPLEYMTRTHHTHLDVRDHIVEADLKASATIVAAMVWQAANRPELMPRKPLPQEPVEP